MEVSNMKVKDIMSTDVVCLSRDDTVERAAQLMDQNDIGSIPVCDGSTVVGIVTDRDIALRSVGAGGDGRQTVGQIMTMGPVVANPEADVHEAAKLMSEHQIRRIPIVQQGSLVGIVSLGDISTNPQLQSGAEQALSNISQPGGSHMT
jgi:CBS domain-containing protein